MRVITTRSGKKVIVTGDPVAPTPPRKEGMITTDDPRFRNPLDPDAKAPQPVDAEEPEAEEKEGADEDEELL